MCPPTPHAFGAGGGHTRWVEKGWGVNSSEDAIHSSVLYTCKYFVLETQGLPEPCVIIVSGPPVLTVVGRVQFSLIPVF